MGTKITKVSEVLNLVHSIYERQEEVQYSPLLDGSRFGCDCGCGGDMYTEEEWNKEGELLDEAETAIGKLVGELAERLGLDVDMIVQDGRVWQE